MQLGVNSEGGCHLCPRLCGAARDVARGFCGAPANPEAATVTLHTGEEPPLSTPGGIVNIFFAHCNLHCIYCQNGDIAAADVEPSLVRLRTVDAIADEACRLLPRSNGLLGLVTAAHYIHLVPALLDAIRQRGFSPTVVYNTSAYETVDSLRTLEGLVDIYLPDLKYMDPVLARRYSHAEDYPDVAAKAILEMKRQVGVTLKCDDGGTAFRGLIVRHLVLPGHSENSMQCLQWLDDHFPPSLHLSLMAQYFPPCSGLPSPLDHTLTAAEYEPVAQRARDLGFRGWLQQIDANANYRPHFHLSDTPFL
ncbi:MAG: hypothetical protein IJ745_03270 [Bacteroidales bacterium]|nr:hypothetical protein [Bacteroidales bacterium]